MDHDEIHARAEELRRRLTGSSSPLARATQELGGAAADDEQRAKAAATLAHVERLLSIVDRVDYHDEERGLAAPQPHTPAAAIGPVVRPPRFKRR